jgi:thymidylate synthase (FAD)
MTEKIDSKDPESRDRDSEGALERPQSTDLNSLLGQTFHVLDSGFVRVVDYMGDDRAVVQAARVSYGSGTKRLTEDRGLIRYLMRHRHTTPFEMCELKLHVRTPMDVWRQWIRHRTANVNEYSTRYSIAIDTCQKTAPDAWRQQSASNKQGGGASLPLEEGARFTLDEQDLHTHLDKVYKSRIAAGIAREQARKDLPLSTYTEAYWKIDLHNLLHFLELRLNQNAQLEIRSYARVIGEEIVAKWVPLVWEAFVDFRLASVTWSRVEFDIAKSIIAGDGPSALQWAASAGLLNRSPDGKLLRSREREELENKLLALDLVVPWNITS